MLSRYTLLIFLHIITMETSQQSQLFQISTSSLEDSPASPSQWLDNVWDSMTPVELFSLNLRGFCKPKHHNILSLKTSKDCCLMTVDALSKPSSPRLLSWGMTSNGKCLTAAISEYRKVEKGFTLSDILEVHPDPTYFHSPNKVRFLKSAQHSRLVTLRRGVKAFILLKKGKSGETLRPQNANDTKDSPMDGQSVSLKHSDIGV